MFNSIKEPNTRVFILGERRSGSNLLRTLLNTSPEIVAPHPPHILHTFSTLVPSYGDLTDEQNWRGLVEDVVRSVNLSPVSMYQSGEEMRSDDIFKYEVERSLRGVQDAIYRAVMDEIGATSWICKSNDNIHYLPKIEDSYGESARYIHLVRDGRDVYNSFLNAPIGPKHPYIAALEWQEIQRKIFDWTRKVSNRALLIRYEDLITDTQKELERICSFLGISFTEEMLNSYASAEAKKTADKSKLWKNVNKPVMRGNSKKYLRLPMKDMQLYENAAGQALEDLEYPLYFRERQKPTSEQVEKIISKDQRLRKEAEKREKNDGGNRSKQVAFLKILRQERGVSPPKGSKISGI